MEPTRVDLGQNRNGRAPTARKPHRDFAGYVTERRNPYSGGHTIILDARNGGDWAGSEEDGRWIVLCNEHSTLVQTTSRPGAQGAMEAVDFCEACMAIAAALKATP